MTQLFKNGVYFFKGDIVEPQKVENPETPVDAYEKTLAYRILRSHSVRDKDLRKMHFRFDTLVSCGVEGAEVIKKADASGLEYFPVPCVLGGDSDKLAAFSQSAAKRFGGFFAPLAGAELHAYVCRQLAACGNMVLNLGDVSWSGALGCITIKGNVEELKKQINVETFDAPAPKTAIVMLEGECVSAEGVASALKKAFSDGAFAGMAVEICGNGLKSLTAVDRMKIDSVIDENDCFCTVWHTDGETEKYFKEVKRPEAFEEMKPMEGAYYDVALKLDMSKVSVENEKINIPKIDEGFIKSKTYNGFPIPNPDIKLTEI